MKRLDFDRIMEKLAEIDRTLILNTTHLAEHMRRTEILESEIKPVKQHVQVVNTIFKVGVVLLGLLVSLKKLNIY